jgi:hypothetical protein
VWKRAVVAALVVAPPALAIAGCLFDYAGAERCANGGCGGATSSTTASSSVASSTSSAGGAGLICTELSHGHCALGQPCLRDSDCGDASCDENNRCAPPLDQRPRRWLRLVGSLPDARYGSVMVVRADTDVFLYGGRGGPGVLAQDTSWTLDSAGWTNTGLANPPPARSFATMAYDLDAGAGLLVGGISPDAGTLQDTWLLDEAAGWQPAASPSLPEKVQHASMVFDSLRKKFVLFGGIDENKTPLAKLYERTESGPWTLVDAAVPPGVTLKARYVAAMLYEPKSGRAILFGGRTSTNGGPISADNEMWAYDPIPTPHWTEIPGSTDPTKWPSARFGHVMAYDPERNVAVLFGGMVVMPGSTMTFTDTWEFHFKHGTWKKVDAGPPPQLAASVYASMVYDAANERMVLYGSCADSACAMPVVGTFVYAQLGMTCSDDSDCLNGSCRDNLCCDTFNSECALDCKCNTPQEPGVCVCPPDGGP